MQFGTGLCQRGVFEFNLRVMNHLRLGLYYSVGLGYSVSLSLCKPIHPPTHRPTHPRTRTHAPVAHAHTLIQRLPEINLRQPGQTPPIRRRPGGAKLRAPPFALGPTLLLLAPVFLLLQVFGLTTTTITIVALARPRPRHAPPRRKSFLHDRGRRGRTRPAGDSRFTFATDGGVALRMGERVFGGSPSPEKGGGCIVRCRKIGAQLQRLPGNKPTDEKNQII
jgi:hypothetical protein